MCILKQGDKMQINRLFEIVYILLDKKTITAKAFAERFAVSKTENDELSVKIIPTGKYAKFSVHGHMEKAVAKAWGEIWKMDLDRSFTGDFEEYLTSDWENADIDIYIALK